MRKYSLLLLISCIWGSQFFFVALVTNDVGAITLSLLKALIGAICLSVISIFLKKDSNHVNSKYYWAIAIFEVVIPFVLIAQGQKYVTSSNASMVIAMVPIITLILVVFFFKNKVSKFQIISILLGFAGIGILSWPTHEMDGSSTVFGNALLLLAAMSFALSLILMEKLEAGSPIVHMRNVLGIATVILLPMAMIFEQPFQLNMSGIQIVAVTVLGIFHSGIVYMLYNLLIKKEGALFASFSNYVVPVVGVLLGYFMLKEPIGIRHFVGICIILCALLLSKERVVHKEDKI